MLLETPSKFALFFVLTAFLNGAVLDLPAVAESENYLAGKIYGSDRTTGLVGATVRVVETKTGLARETKTSKEGLYRFENFSSGIYSASVSYGGKDYLLSEKLNLEKPENAKSVFLACLALNENGTLMLLDSCDVGKENGFPPAGYVILSIVAFVFAKEVTKEEEKVERVASPSRP